jgi:hypothetical protein
MTTPMRTMRRKSSRFCALKSARTKPGRNNNRRAFPPTLNFGRELTASSATQFRSRFSSAKSDANKVQDRKPAEPGPSVGRHMARESFHEGEDGCRYWRYLRHLWRRSNACMIWTTAKKKRMVGLLSGGRD